MVLRCWMLGVEFGVWASRVVFLGFSVLCGVGII